MLTKKQNSGHNVVELHCRLVIKVNRVLVIDLKDVSTCRCYSFPNHVIGGIIIKNIKYGFVRGDLYLIWSGEINFLCQGSCVLFQE